MIFIVKSQLLKLISVILIVLCASVGVLPQGSRKKTPPTNSAKPRAAIETYLSTPFDSNVLNFSLGPGFRGHDFSGIYKIISGLRTRKSEFESTEQYRERIRLMESRNIVGSVNLTSRLAFVVPPKTLLSVPQLSASYNADAAKLNVTLMTDFGSLRTDEKPLESDEPTEPLAFAVSTSGPRMLKTYIGETGLGVKRRVTVVEYVRTNLVFTNCKASTGEENAQQNESRLRRQQLLTNLAAKSAGIAIPLSPKDAIDLKYNLGALVVGHLVPPFSSYKRSLWASAKVNAPSEIWVNEHVLFMDITELWLYSTSTGKVYAKIPECTLRPEERFSSSLAYNYLF